MSIFNKILNFFGLGTKPAPAPEPAPIVPPTFNSECTTDCSSACSPKLNPVAKAKTPEPVAITTSTDEIVYPAEAPPVPVEVVVQKPSSVKVATTGTVKAVTVPTKPNPNNNQRRDKRAKKQHSAHQPVAHAKKSHCDTLDEVPVINPLHDTVSPLVLVDAQGSTWEPSTRSIPEPVSVEVDVRPSRSSSDDEPSRSRNSDWGSSSTTSSSSHSSDYGSSDYSSSSSSSSSSSDCGGCSGGD